MVFLGLQSIYDIYSALRQSVYTPDEPTKWLYYLVLVNCFSRGCFVRDLIFRYA